MNEIDNQNYYNRAKKEYAAILVAVINNNSFNFLKLL